MELWIREKGIFLKRGNANTIREQKGCCGRELPKRITEGIMQVRQSPNLQFFPP